MQLGYHFRLRAQTRHVRELQRFLQEQDEKFSPIHVTGPAIWRECHNVASSSQPKYQDSSHSFNEGVRSNKNAIFVKRKYQKQRSRATRVTIAIRNPRTDMPS